MSAKSISFIKQSIKHKCQYTFTVLDFISIIAMLTLLIIQSLIFIEAIFIMLKALAFRTALQMDFLYLAVDSYYLHMYGGGPEHGLTVTQENHIPVDGH